MYASASSYMYLMCTLVVLHTGVLTGLCVA